MGLGFGALGFWVGGLGFYSGIMENNMEATIFYVAAL